MVNGLYVMASGMVPRIVQMDNVSNNLANVSTHGYKKSSVFLRQLITASRALDHAMGVESRDVPTEVWIDFSQGTFEKTDNTFDVALNGSGFFRVLDTSGRIYYTRDGRFHRDPNGFLVNNEEMFLLNNLNKIIRIEGNDMVIMGNGDVTVDGENVDTIGLAEFNENDYSSLMGTGAGLFEKPATVNEIPSGTDTQFYQGYLEDANVEPVHTMVDMIEIFREFELGQKAIQIQDQTLQRVVTEVGVLR